METQLAEQKTKIQRYLFSSNITFLQEVLQIPILRSVAALITFYDLPMNVLNCIELSGSQGELNYLEMLIELKKLKIDTNSVQIITQLFQQGF